jgi:hypothetical protein
MDSYKINTDPDPGGSKTYGADPMDRDPEHCCEGMLSNVNWNTSPFPPTILRVIKAGSGSARN